MAVKDEEGGAKATGVRWWLQFHAARGTQPIQHLDGRESLQERLDAESTLMDFVVWLVVCRPSGRPISAKTARRYVGQVVTWMRRVYSADFAGNIDLRNLRDLIKGMRRAFGERPRRERWGVRTQQLRQALDKCLPAGSSKRAQTWRALLTAAFCGLLRGGEVAVPDGENFSPSLHLTRADLRFERDGDGTLMAVLSVRVLKKGVFTGKVTKVYLRSGGSIVDPVVELLRMVELDPVSAADEAATPLFAGAGGEALTRRDVAAMVKQLMAALGLDPARFGAHSLRIGGATAALAAGVPPELIRVAGRWSSDVYEIYMRLTRQAAIRVSATVGSTSFEDVEQGEFVSEELEMLPSELQNVHVDFGDVSEDGDSEEEA